MTICHAARLKHLFTLNRAKFREHTMIVLEVYVSFCNNVKTVTPVKYITHVTYLIV